MFAKGRFGNVVSDDSFLSVACFSFLSNILSICIATKRKNIGAGLGGAQPPFVGNHTSPYPLLLRRGGIRYVYVIIIELQKEKLFEDDSVSRAEACSENDFSFDS